MARLTSCSNRPRRIRPTQSVSGGGDAGAAVPWCSDAAGVWRGSDQAIDATACGDELKIIASIEEPQLIATILSHLERTAPEQSQSELVLRARGPPGQSSLL